MTRHKLLRLVPLLLLALVAIPVLAQEPDPATAAQGLISALQTKQWLLALGFGCPLLVYGLRKVEPLLPSWLPSGWIQSDLGGKLFNLLIAFLLTFGAQLTSGGVTSITWITVVAALLNSMISTELFSWSRNTAKAVKASKASAALALVGILAIAAAPRSVYASPLVICVKGCPSQSLKLTADQDTQLSSTVWFGPSIGVLPFVYNGVTHEWNNPAAPAVGYGVWWRPPGYSATKSLLGANLSLSGDFGDKSHVDPMLTAVFFDNFTIGGGARINFATPAQKSGVNGLFAIGWQTSFGGP